MRGELIKKNIIVFWFQCTTCSSFTEKCTFTSDLEVYNSLFVCGVSSTSSQLINELFSYCCKIMLFALVLQHRGGDSIYEMRCPFVEVGQNARFSAASLG